MFYCKIIKITDRKVKTEGPKILSNDIFYFNTVIIGGPATHDETIFHLQPKMTKKKNELLQTFFLEDKKACRKKTYITQRRKWFIF